MGHERLSAIAILCFIFIVAAPIYGEAEDSDLTAESVAPNDATAKRELLLMEEIPVAVITPAKVVQPILESPSTITVLTREDIESCGLASLSDILRNVPGVDVMSVSPTGRNISMRGLNEVAASRILSLVDGRPVYADFYGITTWELLPVSIDEIERIEIVRGPGSALYGANAFDGIVNIITNTASDTGTRMTSIANQSGRLSGSVVYREKVGDLSYSGSVAWNSISGWDKCNADAGENKVFNGHLQYSLNDKSTLSLSGGIQDDWGDLGTTSATAPRRHDTTANYLEMDYVRSSLKYQVCWRRIGGDVEFESSSSYYFGSNTLDIGLQHSFRLLERNFITWGLDYRLNWVESDALDFLHNQSLLAGYLQDQFRLSEALKLTTGLRYDRHPLTGNNFSPRGSIVYSPIAGHAFRVSAGRAFRNPRFLNSYLSVDYDISIPMIPTTSKVRIRGNRDLKPEQVTSHELGYHGVFGSRFKGGLDIFFNKIRGLIDYVNTETYEENALFPGSPGGVVPSLISVYNSRDASAFGGEITAELLINRYLSVCANYSYQYVTDPNKNKRIKSAPEHKLNPGIYAKLGKRLRISLFANCVDKTVWEKAEIDSYILLNSMISYRLRDTEIALSVFNMMNDRHQEHPEGDEIGRSVVFRLTHQIR